ncbi:hypothetical protein BpHYR1_007840 [Brachionus plicatilis]|uniref:Uncharacterized protein n=1 Tax=Brachionus plicatilis TaxID=10195 RepID=A0A3M7S583_BRAPC|nr:hypothetical protein BpHYR1_007840 [Brachionus plicatilis]
MNCSEKFSIRQKAEQNSNRYIGHSNNTYNPCIVFDSETLGSDRNVYEWNEVGKKYKKIACYYTGKGFLLIKYPVKGAKANEPSPLDATAMPLAIPNFLSK